MIPAKDWNQVHETAYRSRGCPESPRDFLDAEGAHRCSKVAENYVLPNLSASEYPLRPCLPEKSDRFLRAANQLITPRECVEDIIRSGKIHSI